MRLAYCTNFWSHHQSPVCHELAGLLGSNDFRMCLFEPVNQERRDLGWVAAPPDLPWIVGPPATETENHRLREIVLEADVVVLGQVPYNLQEERVATGKPTLIMRERYQRDGFFRLRMLNPRFARGIAQLRRIANHPNSHYLAIGRYAVADARRVGLFGDRIWNWAYFVAPREAPPLPRPARPVRILWAGRFLPLKRVELIVGAAARLKDIEGRFVIDLIGDGPSRQACQRLAGRLGVTAMVRFHDPLSPEEVRHRMAEADIFVFPSNHLEGWGAVVSEAMTEGCVVVASEAAGASGVLIDDRRTGLILRRGSDLALAGLLRELVVDDALRQRVGLAAWEQMKRLWHPRVGASRLADLSEHLLGNRLRPEYHGDFGPCSYIGGR